ncbi:MAG: hypothetical protein ACPGJS_04055 [Flammeovirgaceae bacterium]
MNRKRFISQIGLMSLGLAVAPNTILGQDDRPAAYQKEVVQKFVGASHGKIDVVKELLTEYPNLIYSKWDWGGGDFETGLGAASHVGNKAIANLLIDKGARINLFALTMLGKTKIVKSILKEYPQLMHSLGAHGFTLLHHAKRGGKEAAPLVAYFEKMGMSELKVKLY